MDIELRIERDTIALEAISGADVQRTLMGFFPSIVKEFTGFVGKFTHTEQPSPIVFSSKQKEFLEDIATRKYLDIDPLLAYVPEGLNVTYLKYADALSPAVNHASSILTEVMNPYSIFLSQLISNESQKLSTISFDAIYKKLSQEREDLNIEMGLCFAHGSTKTNSSFGKVTSKNAEWSEIFRITDEMNRKMMEVSRKDLNKKVEECTELLNIIMNKMKRNELAGMSPAVAKNLADGAYQVACELENFAVITYKTMAFTAAVNQTVDHFFKVFKK